MIEDQITKPRLIHPELWKTRPTSQQVEGTSLVVDKRSSALFDICGFGKSKQAIDAACELFRAGEIDTVLVVCPASIKMNWFDLDLGQIAKHNWVDSICYEFKGGDTFIPDNPKVLTWLTCSYDYAKGGAYREKHGDKVVPRTKQGLGLLLNELRYRKVLIVADEAHYLANHQSLRTQALTQLRRQVCCRALAMTGSPLGSRYILDLYSVMEFLDPKILNFQNYYHFRARHCHMGGFQGKQVLRYYDVEVIEEKIRPFVLRRDKIEGLEEKRYQLLTVPLLPESWKNYKSMRDDLLVWLGTGETSLAKHAFTKVLRLGQLTSGLLGGLDDSGELREVSSEKSDFLVEWIRRLKDAEGQARVIVWARFRNEIHRLRRLLEPLEIPVHALFGGQSNQEQAKSVREFQEGNPNADAILLANPKAGGVGFNFLSCFKSFYLSNDGNLLDRVQSEDRIWRRGQVNNCLYWDLIATGPQGQRTIDSTIVKKLRDNIDLCNLTMAEWRHVLEEE